MKGYVHSNKKRVDTLETNSPVNGSCSLFLSNEFRFINIIKEKAKNPLFLQSNRSFDLGINSFYQYQYAVSYTHPSPVHNRKK